MQHLTVISIDPGAGAVARFAGNDPVEVYATPFLQEKAKKKWSAPLMAQLLDELTVDACGKVVCVIEHAQSRQNDSRMSAFAFGNNYGMWQGIIAARGWPLHYITPAVWKPRMVGTGADKRASIRKCLELYPHLAPDMKLVSDHNKAEAVLIGRYFIDNKLKEG